MHAIALLISSHSTLESFITGKQICVYTSANLSCKHLTIHSCYKVFPVCYCMAVANRFVCAQALDNPASEEMCASATTNWPFSAFGNI